MRAKMTRSPTTCGKRKHAGRRRRRRRGAGVPALGRRRQFHVPRLSRIRSRAEPATTKCSRRSKAPASASCAARNARSRRARCARWSRTDLPQSGSMDAIILTKTNARASVHRPGYMDYIGVLAFDDERRAGRRAALPRPVHLGRVHAPAAGRAAGAAQGRSGDEARRASAAIRTRARRCATSSRRCRATSCSSAREDELYTTATGILALQERARTRLFMRRDKYGRFYSCLVYLPRDRFNSDVRERVEATLKRALHGERVDSTIQVGESPLANLHLIVRPKPGDKANYDVAELEAQDRADRAQLARRAARHAGAEARRGEGPQARRALRPRAAGRLHRGSHAARRRRRRRDGGEPARRRRHPHSISTARAARPTRCTSRCSGSAPTSRCRT